MTDIKAAFIEFLLAQSEVTDLVGDRIEPSGSATSSGYPRITFDRISVPNEHHQGGSAGLASLTLQVNSLALTSKKADEITETLREVLDGLEHTTWGSVEILSCFKENDADDIVEPDTGEEQIVYRVRSDYLIWYRED